jgi:hypothetical protein
MARTFKIVDRDGNVLGRFTAPDDATPEQIESAHARFRAQLIEKREREAAQTRITPRSDVLRCGFCGEYVPLDTFEKHLEAESEKEGIPLRLADS